MSGPNKRIAKELQEITETPMVNIAAFPSEDDNLRTWTASITVDNEDSVYHGGTFLLEIRFPDAYPFKPPKVRFLTKIYHPNVYANGKVCLSILGGGWKPSLTIKHVLTGVQALLNEPNPRSPANCATPTSRRSTPR